MPATIVERSVQERALEVCDGLLLSPSQVVEQVERGTLGHAAVLALVAATSYRYIAHCNDYRLPHKDAQMNASPNAETTDIAIIERNAVHCTSAHCA